MKKATLLAAAVICAVSLLAGCGNDQYAVEREYWRLQRRSGKIFKKPEGTSAAALENVIERLKRFAADRSGSDLALEAEFNIARLYTVKKEYDKARTHIEGLLDKYKGSNAISAELLFMLGNTFEIEGHWDEALVRYDRIKEEFPVTLRGFNVPLYIALHYNVRSEAEKMIAALKAAIEHYTALAKSCAGSRDGLKASALKAQTQIFLKDYNGAVETFRKTIEKYGEKFDVDGLLIDMALIYNRELKDKVNAQKALEQLMKEYPDSKLTKTAAALLKELDKGVKEQDKE